ncbi:MAG: hypothetical protein K5945_02935 [Bacteroidaceae bacterium]|nr:hypothetical protein [Bacteroidaceae bacterium]
MRQQAEPHAAASRRRCGSKQKTKRHTGDDKAGIVFNGLFISDPYPDEDWAGSTKRSMYVDMV